MRMARRLPHIDDLLMAGGTRLGACVSRFLRARTGLRGGDGRPGYTNHGSHCQAEAEYEGKGQPDALFSA